MITRFKAAAATFLSVAMAFSTFATLPANAASTSTVIKGSTSTLYWYASNGNRYVFPNSNTYYTWFGDFLNVNTVSDSELSAMPLVGNVTYRPGARLVKVESDPKVYAVSRYGILRWVTSEYLASQLYGGDWRSKVQDIPAVFFSNYTVGSAISNVSDYSVANEYNGVSTPNDNISGLGSSNNTTGYGFTLNASRTSINPGEAVELTATSYAYSTSNARIDIYDTRNTSSIVRTCSNTSTCSVTVYPARNGSENNVQYYAIMRDQNGSTVVNAYGPVIYFGNVNGTGSTNTGTRFTTTVSRTSVNAGESVTLTASLNNTYNLTSSYRVEIQDPRTSQSVQTCWSTTTCSTTQTLNVTGGITNVMFHARLFDTNGNLVADDAFPTITIGNGTGSGTFSSGSVVVTADRSSANAGDYVTILATASNLNTAISNIRMELYRESNNTLLDTCYDQLACSFRTYVTNDGTNAIRYYVIVKSDFGQQLPNAYSPRITVNGGTTGTTGTNTLSLSASQTSIASGTTVRLTANAYSASSFSYSGTRIEIVDSRTSAIVSTCYNQSWCAPDLTVYRSGTETGMQFYAVLKNASGNELARGYAGMIWFTDSGTGTYQQTGSNQVTNLDLVVNPTQIVPGTYTRLTANAYNMGNWSYTGNRIEIRDLRTNAIVKTCYDQSWCVAEVYPMRNGSESSVSYGARIYDRNGNLLRESTSQVMLFSETNGTGSTSAGTLTGTTDIFITPTPTRGGYAYVNAAISNASLAMRDVYIRIYQGGTLIGTCQGVQSCSAMVVIPNAAWHTTTYATFGTTVFPGQLTSNTINIDVN